AVPGRLQRPAAAEHIQQRQIQLHLGRRHADEDDRTGEITPVERLLIRLRPSDRLYHHVGAVALGEVPNLLDRVGFPRVDRVRRAELARPRELAPVDIDADDLASPGEACPEYRSAADAAAADHRDRIAATDLTGVQRRAEPGHHAAAE